MAPALFAVGIGIRAALVGAAVFAILELVAIGRFYATAIVLGAVAALILADLARYIARGDRMLERFVEGLAAGELEHPARNHGGFDRLRGAIERAVAALDAARVRPQQQIDHLQSLIDTVPVAIVTQDEAGEVTLANRAARRLAGRGIARLEHLGDTAATRLPQLPPGQRCVLRLGNGQRVLASVARFSAGDRPVRVFSLQNIESELDAAELQAWQDLLRVLAHEMMNSLTPISSLAESVRPLVERAMASQRDQSGGLRDVADAVDVIARRSSGLLSFVERYRKMADLPPPSLESLSARQLVHRIEQLMRATFESKGIAYSSSMEPADLMIRADGNLLEQALINLVHNAIDAVSGTQHPAIELRCSLRDERCAISVCDNGKGLDSMSVERMFVPFFTTKPGGSGIGLSLARQIAHAHHGRLDAAPNSSAGAIFTLSIPVWHRDTLSS
jgi:two-component system, NtrC family, nitrogen regulation sensor histidine kinase NtrY